MLYDHHGFRASGSRTVSGRSLAQRLRRMASPERAVLAADIIDGKVILRNPTAKAVATIVGVNGSYLFAALRATPEQREQVLRGERPLIVPKRAPASPSVTDWAAVDDVALADIVRAVGIDRTIDAAVAVEHTTA